MTILTAAINAARITGDVLVEWRRRGGKKFEKEGGEVVTAADRLSSIKIKSALNSALGPQNILSEESGFTAGKGDILWIVDPLDGTNNFYAGKNEVSVAIAGVKNGQPVIGVVYNHFENELYTAVYGKGACLNGKPISCSRKDKFESLNLVAELNSSSALKTALPKIIEQLPVSRTISMNSSCIAQARTATGIGDAFIKLSIRFWDAAAGHAILRESGCIVTDCYGNPLLYDKRYIIKCAREKKKPRHEFGMLAAPPAIHGELVKKVSEIRNKLRV